MNRYLSPRRGLRSGIGFALKLSLLNFAAASSIGCSSTKANLEPKEIKPKSKNVSVSADTPEKDIFTDAKRLYEQGLFNVARDSFDALRNQYPSGAYADFAEIKTADSYFYGGQYREAAAQYEDYVKSHPLAPANPYMLMMAGKSYSKAQRGVGRDMAPLEKSLEIYDRVLAKYPDSIYASNIPKLRAEVLEVITENQKIIRDYYLKKSNAKAAEARDKQISEKWTPLLAQSEDAAKGEAPPKSAPDGVELAELKIEPPMPFVPAPAAAAKAAKGSEGAAPAQPPASMGSDSRYIVQASCQNAESRILFLELSSELGPESLAELKPADSNGSITIKLKNTFAREQTLDCFASGDVSIKSDGEITVKGAGAPSIMGLSKPPRIALVF